MVEHGGPLIETSITSQYEIIKGVKNKIVALLLSAYNNVVGVLLAYSFLAVTFIPTKAVEVIGMLYFHSV